MMAFSSSAARRFLNDAFSNEDLETFCFDYFSEVQKDLSVGMSKGDKIQKLLEYCQQHEGVEALFKALQERMPELYRKHFGDRPPPSQFEATFTPGDSSSSTEISIKSLSAMTERRIADQMEHIHFYKMIAISLITAGLVVMVGVAVPFNFPITQAVRWMVAAGGLFIGSLSGLQFRAIDQYKDRIGECNIFLGHLEILKQQPVLDAETRAQVTYWMNQAFEGVMKAKSI